MDVFAALEERVEKLITGYKELQSRLAALEEENRKLRSGDEASSHLSERIIQLETERSEIRARLEKLLKNVAALELWFAPRACFFFHCAAFVLPGGLAAARRLLAPARGAPRLLRPRPSSAVRGGAPRCPHDAASPIPHPGSARRVPVACGAMAAPPRRAEFLHPPRETARTPQTVPRRTGWWW